MTAIAPAAEKGALAIGSDMAWDPKIVDLGSKIHYADFGGTGQVMVLVHGIASSHLNWMGIGEDLARSYRVFAVDLPGYGLSPRAPEPATVETSQTYLDRFIDHLSPGAPVVLFGHSMGGLASMLETSAHPEKVSLLMLLAPAAPSPRFSAATLLSAPFLIATIAPARSVALLRRRGRRLDPDRVVRSTMARIIARGSEIPEEIMQAHVDLLALQRRDHDWTEQALVESAGSLVRTLLRRRRFRRMVEKISVPTLLMHGTRDRLVQYRAGVLLHRIRPDWSWRPLAEVGHMAQMERPQLVLTTVWDWLATQRVLER